MLVDPTIYPWYYYFLIELASTALVAKLGVKIYEYVTQHSKYDGCSPSISTNTYAHHS